MINNDRAHFFQLPSPANSQGKTHYLHTARMAPKLGRLRVRSVEEESAGLYRAMLKDMRHWERHSLTVDDTPGILARIHTRGFCRCICKRLCLNVPPVVSSDAHKGASLASANTSFARLVQHV